MRKITLFLLSVCFVCQWVEAQEKRPIGLTQAALPDNTVFTLLDLDYPGLEQVKEAYEQNDMKSASELLLEYYRTRKGVVNLSIDLKNISISKTEQQWADDALKHTFFVHNGYLPAYNYGEDINWQYWPVKDNELRWQLHRHKWFTPMGKAYQLTKDEKYAKEWIYQYLDWVKKNPLEQISQDTYEIYDLDEVKGIAENVRFDWRPLEASHRLQDQINQFTLFIESDSFTSSFLAEFLVNYHRHAKHILHNYSKEGNHLLFEAQRMLCAGAFFPEFKEAAIWRKSGIDILNREIKKQVYDDGGQYELDLGYHVACIEIFNKALAMADANGFGKEFSDSYVATIKNMIDFYSNLRFPDYTFPCFSDARHGNLHNELVNFTKWSKQFPVDEQLRYFATQGKEGRQPQYLSKGFTTSGFFAFRNGWKEDATVMILKAGPQGEWHCQPDNGTFELWYNGKNLFPDSGSYIYGGNDEVQKQRDWFRQTAVHNTLTLDNKNLETTQSVTRLWNPDSNMPILVTENPGYKGLKHRRSVFFVDGSYFVIVDEAIGERQGIVNLHYQLAEGEVKIDKNSGRIISTYSGESNVLLQCFVAKGTEIEEEEGWYSVAYRERAKRPAVVFNTPKKSGSPVRYITIIYPQKQVKASMKISAQIKKATEERLEVKVKVDGKKRTLEYQL